MKTRFIYFFIYFILIFNVYSETPNDISIHGKVLSKEVYGPPTFGENPNLDVKEKVYYLSWDKAEEFIIDGKSTKIKELQLIFLSSKKNLISLQEGIPYDFSGKINIAETGHHYTEYIFIVNNFEESLY